MHGQKYLGITEGVEVEVDGERNCAINLAEAAAHVLLKPLHMHSQQRRTPAHVTATTHTWMPRQESIDTMKPMLSICKVKSCSFFARLHFAST